MSASVNPAHTSTRQAKPNFSGLYHYLAVHGQETTGLLELLASLPASIQKALNPKRYPEFAGWWQAVEKMPYPASEINLDASAVTASGANLSAGELAKTHNLLKQLMPWRKGPFDLHGIYIDTEWRSDFKWDRLAEHLTSAADFRLAGAKVLDVGGGNGYHAWRLAGAGAEFTLCIDPTIKYFAQFSAVKKLLGQKLAAEVYHLPLALEDLPPKLEAFDLVLSMGVLYHRQAPMSHLYELKDCLRKGGKLVLETLIIDGDETSCLVPEDRYAAMNNVWFLPSLAMLKIWLAKCGFTHIECIDINTTSTEEQRATEYMNFQSLADFLDPNNPSLTREGHPAPQRAMLVATKP